VTFGIDSASTAGACTGTGTGAVSFGGSGLCVIDANQAGGSGYAPAPQVQQSVTIAPATLTVTADSASRLFGAANPALTATITGFVVIGNAGDGASGCGANTITGPVTLTGNGAGVQLGGNLIHGPVRLTGNSGGTSPGTAVSQVAANQIGGPLACSGNTPAPTDDNQPNTVAGPASGQCAGLA
jgi:hypothetical protein